MASAEGRAATEEWGRGEGMIWRIVSSQVSQSALTTADTCEQIVFVFFLQSNKDHAVDSDLFSSKP
jgi:hypothetical protein